MVDIIFLWILVNVFVDIRRHVYNPHTIHIVFLWIVLKFDCDVYENEMVFFFPIGFWCKSDLY